MPAITPNPPKLPPRCFARLPSTGQAIAINRGETGYYPIFTHYTPEQLNAALPEPPTPGQIEAMLAGSMFGWEQPIADPARHPPLDAGTATAAPVIPRVAEWGGPAAPFRMEGCDMVYRERRDSPDPLWSHAGGQLGFYGWLRVANCYATRTFLSGLLQLPPRDWLGLYNGRVPPTEAADIAFDEYESVHGIGSVPRFGSTPPAT